MLLMLLVPAQDLGAHLLYDPVPTEPTETFSYTSASAMALYLEMETIEEEGNLFKLDKGTLFKFVSVRLLRKMVQC